MDAFRADMVYSSIDRQGRYAYRNQPALAQWNLSWLAQALIPLLDDDESVAVPMAQRALDGFVAHYENAYAAVMLKKLGLTESSAENIALIDDLLKLMAEAGADYTLTFRSLAEQVNPQPNTRAGIGELLTLPESFAPWLARWRERLTLEASDPVAQQQLMYAANPAFIPRNHLVEEAINAATLANDFRPFHQLVDVLANPYVYDAALSRYATPPTPEQIVSRTFCGT
jgi:uncharacterized protein YdiU (UPF0061 family)